MRNFTIIKEIGRGYFGTVSLVRHKPTSKYFAMKVLRKKFLAEQRQQKHVICNVVIT